MIVEPSKGKPTWGVACKICGGIIELDESQQYEAMQRGRIPFQICDDCCAFIRKLKERETE